MKRFARAAAYGLTVFVLSASGYATPEHRMNVAASRDQDRRADFERCRAEGRSDCDLILNAPVDSNTASGDSVGSASVVPPMIAVWQKEVTTAPTC
jgi:hypothetical protein